MVSQTAINDYATMTETTDTNDTDEEHSTARRAVLTGLAGLGAAGVFGAGRASAQSTPEGQVGTDTNPYLVAHMERLQFSARTSDPSSPSDGLVWYRGDLS